MDIPRAALSCIAFKLCLRIRRVQESSREGRRWEDLVEISARIMEVGGGRDLRVAGSYAHHASLSLLLPIPSSSGSRHALHGRRIVCFPGTTPSWKTMGLSLPWRCQVCLPKPPPAGQTSPSPRFPGSRHRSTCRRQASPDHLRRVRHLLSLERARRRRNRFQSMDSTRSSERAPVVSDARTTSYRQGTR